MASNDIAYTPPAYCDVCGLFVPVNEYAKHRQGSNLRCLYSNYDFVKIPGGKRDYACIFGSCDKNGNLIPGNLDHPEMLSGNPPGRRNSNISVPSSKRGSRRNSADNSNVVRGRDCPCCKLTVDERTYNRHRGGSDKYCVFKHYELVRDSKVDGGFRIIFGRIEKNSGRIISPTLRGREDYVNAAQENAKQRQQRLEFLKNYKKRHQHEYENLHKPVLFEPPRKMYRGISSGPMDSDVLFPEDISYLQMILIAIALIVSGFIAGRGIGNLPNLTKEGLGEFLKVLQEAQKNSQ